MVTYFLRATTIIAAAAILLPVFCNHASAQQISGSVTCSNSGQPLAGASVIVKGTTVGTATDIAGNYRLAADSSHTALVFSAIGYKSREVKIGNDTIVNVTLTEEYIALYDLHVRAEVCVETKITMKRDTVRVKKFGIRKFKISRFREAIRIYPVKREDTFLLLKVNKQWAKEWYSWDWHESDMYQHIYNHIGYPESTARNGIVGWIFVGFKIDSEGNVKDVELRRGLDELIDEDILSVIRSMPKLTACEMKRLRRGSMIDNANFVLRVHFRIIKVYECFRDLPRNAL